VPGLSRVLLAAALLLAVLTLAACDRQQLSPSAERGRQVFLAQCVSCHGSDPVRDGPLGPALKGSSRALLEAKVLNGAYPPGHAPKRPTNVMPPLPALAGDIGALADYLR
jgi:mono/diheme cytochrome c family protein